jgi:hypothetical protein
MKPISCFYITGGIVTVLAVSLFFAYRKKQEEIKAVLEKERETVREKEGFRGVGGANIGGGHGSVRGDSGESLNHRSGLGYPWYFAYLGVPVALDADCGVYGTCV